MFVFERESVITQNLQATGGHQRTNMANTRAVESAPDEGTNCHDLAPRRVQRPMDCHIPRTYSIRSRGKSRSLRTLGLRPSRKNSNTDQMRLAIGRLRSFRRDQTYSTSRGKVHRLRVRMSNPLQTAS